VGRGGERDTVVVREDNVVCSVGYGGIPFHRQESLYTVMRPFSVLLALL